MCRSFSNTREDPRSWLPAYPREGLMHCHISWHVALFALILGDATRAWRIYEAQVHPGGA